MKNTIQFVTPKTGVPYISVTVDQLEENLDQSTNGRPFFEAVNGETFLRVVCTSQEFDKNKTFKITPISSEEMKSLGL